MITFYSNNLIDLATATASNANALFPVSNLKDPRRSKVVRTTTASDTIVFDFGSAKTINSIVIAPTMTGFGVSGITLELNSTNTWTSPAVSQVVMLNTTHGFGYKEFSNQSYRYARLVLTSSLSYCEISKVFIGQSISFSNGMGIDLGWNYQDKELANIKENRYGQKFIDTILRQKQISFSLKSMNKDELDQVLEIYDSKGMTKPFYMRLGDTTMINDPARFSGMFYLNSIPQINNKSFGLYDMSTNLEEAT